MSDPVNQILGPLLTEYGWLLAGVLLVSIAFSALGNARKGKRRNRPSKPERDDGQSTNRLRHCKIAVRPLMSREQADVFAILRPYAEQRGLHLLAEVSLSAVFKVTADGNRKRAFSGFGTIRQKYVDLLLTDAKFVPVCGVEYHGSGHWGGNAIDRDRVKRSAFKAAGLPLIEISKGDDLLALPLQLDRVLTDSVYSEPLEQMSRRKPPGSRIA